MLLTSCDTPSQSETRMNLKSGRFSLKPKQILRRGIITFKSVGPKHARSRSHASLLALAPHHRIVERHHEPEKSSDRDVATICHSVPTYHCTKRQSELHLLELMFSTGWSVKRVCVCVCVCCVCVCVLVRLRKCVCVYVFLGDKTSALNTTIRRNTNSVTR